VMQAFQRRTVVPVLYTLVDHDLRRPGAAAPLPALAAALCPGGCPSTRR